MSPSDDRIEFGWEHREEPAGGRVSYGRRDADGPAGHDDRVEFGFVGDEPPSRTGWPPLLLRSRILAASLAVVAIVGIGVAVVGRLPIADRSAAPEPTAGLNGLTVDQSACFSFGLVHRRAELLMGSRLPHGVGPRAKALGDEVAALDRLATHNRLADYRLVSAFADVADEAVRLIGVRGRRSAAAIAVDWVAAADAARAACIRIAAFDVEELQPVAG